MILRIPQFLILFFSIFFLNTFLLGKVTKQKNYDSERQASKIFKKNFKKKYKFIDGDRFGFLDKMGINVEDDLLDFHNLQYIEKKQTGASAGGIYALTQDPSQIYYLKKTNAFREFIASRLMKLIVDPRAIPDIKIVKNKSRTTASLKLPSFNIIHKTDLTNKKIVGEVLLEIAMDFIGLIDRHGRNVGYVTIDENTLLAARVDLDACLDFESVATGTHQFPTRTRHLELKHLYVTMQTYPKDEVESAMRRVIDIPDEQIVSIFVEAWGALSKTPSPKNYKKCLKYARKVVERKHAFKKALKKFSRKGNKDASYMFH